MGEYVDKAWVPSARRFESLFHLTLGVVYVLKFLL
jgi:hypothetical protein